MSTSEPSSQPRKSQDLTRKSVDLKRAGPGPSYLDHRFRSNAHTGPRATPSIPSGGKWSVYAEVKISTPPKYPYEALVNIHDWREWNSFMPDVLVTKHPSPHSRTLKLEQGTFMTFTLQLTPTEKTTSKEVCQHLEQLKSRQDGNERHKDQQNTTRIRWASDNANLMTPGFVIKSERVNDIVEGETDGSCVYRTWITFAGLQAKSLKKKYGEAYQARIADFAEDLKARSEALYRKDTRGINGGH